jgi:hypothetical protein
MPNRASEGDPGCTAIARRGGGRSIATGTTKFPYFNFFFISSSKKKLIKHRRWGVR